MVFAMASLGLPGLGNFVAEFLVLLGAFQDNALVIIVAILGLIVAALYALWLIQQTFHGMPKTSWPLADLAFRDMAVMALIILALVWIGLYPQPILHTAAPALHRLQPVVQQQATLKDGKP